MVKIALQIKAQLVNVEKLYPHDRREFSWPIKVKCTGCGEENPHWHLVSEDGIIDLPNNVDANFAHKCKCCSRENHLCILPQRKASSSKGKKGASAVCKEYTSEDEGSFRTLVVFDCRGLEITAFDFRDGWAAVSGSHLFPDVDLSDADGWTEYNDTDGVLAEISDVEYQLVVTIKCY